MKDGRWRRRVAVFGGTIALAACVEKPSPQPGDAGRRAPVSSAAESAEPVPNAIPSAAQHPRTPREMLAEWTRALNDADMGGLERLYADRVRFYGSSLTRTEVLERKRLALTRTRTFKQAVQGDPSLEDKGTVIRVGFRKRSGAEGAQNDVFATLVLRTEPRLLIEEETDAATEKRFASASAPLAVPKDCASAVWLLVESTPEAQRVYRRIEKNLAALPKDHVDLSSGGMGPFTPDMTGDGTYEYAIGVHHPERFESYAWFTVDVSGKVKVSAFTLDLLDAPATPSKASLKDFERLCAADAGKP